MDLSLAAMHPEIALADVERALTAHARQHGFDGVPPGDSLQVILKTAPTYIESGGFMADIFRLKFVVKGRAGGRPDHEGTAILKAVTIRNFAYRKKLNGDASDDAIDKAILDRLKKILFRMDTSEALFYQRIAPLFAGAARKLSFRLPISYYSRPCSSPARVDGFLLIEDLDNGRVGTITLAEGINKHQVDAAIEAIAQFHALSLTAPYDLGSLYPLRDDLYFDYKKYEMVKTFTELPDTDYFQRNEAAFQTLFERHSRPTFNTFGLRPVLCHNDYWHSNIFFEKSSDGEFTSKLTHIIDFQNVQYAAGVEDIIRLIFCGTAPELRRVHLDDWLELYARSYCAAAAQLAPQVPLGANGERFDEAAVLERVRQAYEFHRHFELIFMVFLYYGNIAKLPVCDSRRVTLVERCAQAFDDLKNDYDNI